MFSRIVRFVGFYSNRYQKSIANKAFITNFTKRSSNSRNKNIRSYVSFLTPIYFAGFWGSSNNQNTKSSSTAKEVLFAKADTLFNQEKFKEVYDLLSGYKDSDDVEILWRICRAMYNMSKLPENSATAKKLIYEAYDLASYALSLEKDNWAVHKWIAILLNSKTTYEGTKVKIKELYNIKNHMLRAIELNPKDATTLYMIGNWCYQVADLAWYQRTIASTIFGEPPVSSFDEALMYFEKAEQADPNFYSHNLLMLGKTYSKLNQKEKAIEYLTKASEFIAKNDDDLQAKQEATKFLSSLRT